MPPVSKLRKISSTAAGRARILAALRAAGGVIPEAARRLGVPSSTLHEALGRYLTDLRDQVEIAVLSRGRPRKSAPDKGLEKSTNPVKKST